jgi:hypothetical protein
MAVASWVDSHYFRWMIGSWAKKTVGRVVEKLKRSRAQPPEEDPEMGIMAGFARLALAGMGREYPHKPGYVLEGPDGLRAPREVHPVFFGHFDWHSSVHGHWTLVRLLRLYPAAPFAEEVRAVLDRQLAAGPLEAEAAWFREPRNKSFERMYGWAWAVKLGDELRRMDDADARRWAGHYAPLEAELRRLAGDYLPKLAWPVRCGFHPESAFPLGCLLDHARRVEDRALEALVLDKARGFYGGDRDYPVAYEPSGNDFFSPGLNVADLMRRVLAGEEFGTWLDSYLPGLREGRAGNLLEPVVVGDPADGHLVHLAGLNLSRAWTMRGICAALPEGDARREVLQAAAGRHLDAGLPHVTSGHYEGDHWLGSFALLAMTGH